MLSLLFTSRSLYIIYSSGRKTTWKAWRKPLETTACLILKLNKKLQINSAGFLNRKYSNCFKYVENKKVKMKTSFLVIFLALDICAGFTNSATLFYITKTFNVKTHVFTLIFLDSLNSSVCSVFSTLINSLLLAGQIPANIQVCLLAFLTGYLPNCFGAILTVLISIVRYSLAKLSARNIQPSNKKVSAIALGVFTALAALTLFICLTHAVFDLPLAISIEVCANRDVSARPVKLLSTLFLLIPNIYYLSSLAVDLKMIIFLRKVLIPTKPNVLSGLGTYFLQHLKRFLWFFL